MPWRYADELGRPPAEAPGLGRQEGLEWIRMDDTVIRRVRSEEVAEAGGEEDPKVPPLAFFPWW
jgi:hypothetical protein